MAMRGARTCIKNLKQHPSCGLLVFVGSLFHSEPRLPAVQTRYFYNTVAHLHPLLYSTPRVGLHPPPLCLSPRYHTAQQHQSYSVLFTRAQGEILILTCFRSGFSRRAPKTTNTVFVWCRGTIIRVDSTVSIVQFVVGYDGWAVLNPLFSRVEAPCHGVRRLRAPTASGRKHANTIPHENNRMITFTLYCSCRGKRTA